MQKISIHAFVLLAAVLVTSCGNGNVETIKADSSITSASVARAPLPATINTDTTTAAPVADTTSSLKLADTTRKAPVPKKKDHKKTGKPHKATGKAAKPKTKPHKK